MPERDIPGVRILHVATDWQSTLLHGSSGQYGIKASPLLLSELSGNGLMAGELGRNEPNR